MVSVGEQVKRYGVAYKRKLKKTNAIKEVQLRYGVPSLKQQKRMQTVFQSDSCRIKWLHESNLAAWGTNGNQHIL